MFTSFNNEYYFIYFYNNCNIFTVNSIYSIDVINKVKNKMKQEIRLAFNYKYQHIVPIYKLPDNTKKEKIVNDNMNKMFHDVVFCSDDNICNH